MVEAAPDLSPLRKANKAEAAEFFGVSLPTIEAWIRRGCPVVQRGRRGVPWVLDLREVAKWRFAPGEEDDEHLDPDRMTPKERLDWFRSETERRKLQERDGELVESVDMEQAVAKQNKAYAQAIETFPDRAEREHGATPAEVGRLQELCDQLRELMYQAAIA